MTSETPVTSAVMFILGICLIGFGLCGIMGLMFINTIIGGYFGRCVLASVLVALFVAPMAAISVSPVMFLYYLVFLGVLALWWYVFKGPEPKKKLEKKLSSKMSNRERAIHSAIVLMLVLAVWAGFLTSGE